jgi:hypothetical protein
LNSTFLLNRRLLDGNHLAFDVASERQSGWSVAKS